MSDYEIINSETWDQMPSNTIGQPELETRSCNTCGEVKPLTSEYWQSKKGTPYFYRNCKKCRSIKSNTRQKERYHEDVAYREKINKKSCEAAKNRRQLAKRSIKYGGHPQCSVCGSTEHKKSFHNELPLTRICKICGEEKPLTSEFWNDGNNGRGGTQRWFFWKCKTCDNKVSRQYQKDNWERLKADRDRRAKEIIKALDTYKARRGCIECGESDPIKLQFHHINPDEKEFNVCSGAATTSVKKIEEEIEKCLVMCYACHRQHHYRLGHRGDG